MRGDVHTNSIEAFWFNVKRSIKMTHVWVSKKHLQTYLCEFEYLYNFWKGPSCWWTRFCELSHGLRSLGKHGVKKGIEFG